MGVKVREHKVTYHYLTAGLLTLLISTSMAVTACEKQFEDAVATYQRGDYAKAYRLLKPLAQQGIPEAQFNLGLMYANGQGVPQDYAKAEKWYRKAAEQGYALAQLNLGFMYNYGQSVPKDYVLAHMWFNLAVSRFPALEKEEREMAVENRDIATSKMTPAQIAEAQRLAREWKPKKEGK
jgi:hypothetical protein